ncbi:Gonadotropin-releasing hormone II receptor [Toxocara canis]|uniref:Gonadotropin-releasing hormone II receptor n=1 Tax=Toxocara canis TaxID=6265 RepID=A0A0B2VZA4_TOXCA|nr:Gonadotropin-releasing hormone II receptor [Toxocara canis]
MAMIRARSAQFAFHLLTSSTSLPNTPAIFPEASHIIGSGRSAAAVAHTYRNFSQVVPRKIMLIFCHHLSIDVNRFHSHYRRHVILAARLMSFKISLTVADLIVLFVYAPTQIIWISTYNWYGGDLLCRTTKFINTFSLHLTANMQVLIAADRLYITAHLREVHQKSGFAAKQMITIAWVFAITCALPQLFVFHVYYLPDGKPQCVSIWTVLRYRELLLMEASSKHYLEGNSTPAEDYLEDLLPKSEVGSFDQSFLDTNSDLLKFMEHAYNLLHLFSICILPYSIELLCYAIILVLMKRVNKDIRRDGSSGKRCGVLFCCARAKENVHSKALNSCCTELKTDCNVEFKPVGDRMIVHVDHDVRTSLLTADADTNCGLQQEPSEVRLTRKDADQVANSKKSIAAWKNTVALARRKTRRKYFICADITAEDSEDELDERHRRALLKVLV